MRTSRQIVLVAVVAALSLGVCVAQYGRGRGRGRGFFSGSNGPLVQTEGGEVVNEDTVRTARETARHSVEMPDWTNEPAYDRDVFTFARIIFKSRPGRPSWFGWINDYPDSDLNLSYRLQQLTSLKVNPDGRVMKLTDPDLFNYPLIFAAQPGGMELRDEETSILRRYLLRGGVFMVDDFWGDAAWESFSDIMKRVLPERDWVELPIEHPVFHSVVNLRGPIQSLQVPSLPLWERGYDPDDPESNASRFRGPGSREMHVRAWLDERQRIMVIATHNTDNGDGWEREGENEVYFKQFSEPRAYPLGINIIFYLLTR